MGFIDDGAISKTIQIAFACGGKETQVGQLPTYDPRSHTIDMRHEALKACGRSRHMHQRVLSVLYKKSTKWLLKLVLEPC